MCFISFQLEQMNSMLNRITKYQSSITNGIFMKKYIHSNQFMPAKKAL